MMGFVIVIHFAVCLLLIIIILIQAGRGGGLVEGFAGVESMFGAKTSAFLTRSTTVLAVMFFITCLSLAFLSTRQSHSLMSGPAAKASAAGETQAPAPSVTTTQAPETAKATTQAEPVSKEPIVGTVNSQAQTAPAQGADKK